MDLLFSLAFGVVLLSILCIGAMAANQRGSDAAGNGLAQAYLVVGELITWSLLALLLLFALLRAPHHEHDPARSWLPLDLGCVLLFLIAAPSQLPASYLIGQSRTPRLLRALFAAAASAVPLAFLAHIAWRVYAWPSGEPLVAMFGSVPVLLVSALAWRMVSRPKRT
ncbi:MAG: hypothetical protein JNM84_08975 [Planctomycetes bacterium]|nr:hypothetical protein [Planctomycetota bacterium]